MTRHPSRKRSKWGHARIYTPSKDSQIAVALEHHIVDWKKGSHGQITQVKHIKFGWITLEKYYDLQKVHQVLPLIEKVVEGGYRLKAAIYSLTVEIEFAGFGASIPVGPALALTTVGVAAALWEAGDHATAAALVALLMAPFGEIVLLYLFAQAMFKGAAAIPEETARALEQLRGAVVAGNKEFVEGHQEAFWPLLYAFGRTAGFFEKRTPEPGRTVGGTTQLQNTFDPTPRPGAPFGTGTVGQAVD